MNRMKWENCDIQFNLNNELCVDVNTCGFIRNEELFLLIYWKLFYHVSVYWIKYCCCWCCSVLEGPWWPGRRCGRWMCTGGCSVCRPREGAGGAPPICCWSWSAWLALSSAAGASAATSMFISMCIPANRLYATRKRPMKTRCVGNIFSRANFLLNRDLFAW